MLVFAYDHSSIETSKFETLSLIIIREISKTVCGGGGEIRIFPPYTRIRNIVWYSAENEAIHKLPLLSVYYVGSRDEKGGIISSPVE